MAVSYTLLMHPRFQSLLLDGTPNAGGQVYAYLAGTTTPATTYRDAGMTMANPSPVILDAAGCAEIFYAGPYKLVCLDADGVQLWSADNIFGFNGDVVASLPAQDQDKLLVWDSTSGAFKNSALTLSAIETAVKAFETITMLNGGVVAADAGDASAGVLTDKLIVGPGLEKQIVEDDSGVKKLFLNASSPVGSSLFLYQNCAGL